MNEARKQFAEQPELRGDTARDQRAETVLRELVGLRIELRVSIALVELRDFDERLHVGTNLRQLADARHRVHRTGSRRRRRQRKPRRRPARRPPHRPWPRQAPPPTSSTSSGPSGCPPTQRSAA